MKTGHRIKEGESDIFLSYASADLNEAESLEKWLQSSPRNYTVWRDRRGIKPGAPDYYEPIRDAISSCPVFMILLSPRWLSSQIALREFSDAETVGKKIIAVVHSSAPRDPITPGGRESKSILFRSLEVWSRKTDLEKMNWIWPKENEMQHIDFLKVEEAIETDYSWAKNHARIVQRLNRWKELRDNNAFLRGSELTELMSDAFKEAKTDRKPKLTEEERNFLLESQKFEMQEKERVEGLYWGAQSRAGAFAARERAEEEPDTALLLAAEAVSVSSVPEAKQEVLSLLHRYASLISIIYGHGKSRMISGIAFSKDGRWLISADRMYAINDDRPSILLIHDTESGKEVLNEQWNHLISSVTWGEKYVAVAIKGEISIFTWDETYKTLSILISWDTIQDTVPDYLAFSPEDQYLAYGTQWGDLGILQLNDRSQWQGRLSGDGSSESLRGIGWLDNERLILAENSRILIRPVSDLNAAVEVTITERVYSMDSDKERWVISCRKDGRSGLLIGQNDAVATFLPAPRPDLTFSAAFAGPGTDSPMIVVGSAMQRSGYPVLMQWRGEAVRNTLLTGGDLAIAKVTSDPSGRFIAAGDTSGRIWLWDLFRPSHISRYLFQGKRFRCMSVSYSSGVTALVTSENNLMICRSVLSEKTDIETGLPFMAERIMFTQEGSTLVVTGPENQICLVDEKGRVNRLSWPSGVIPDEITVSDKIPVMAVSSGKDTIYIMRIEENSLKVTGEIRTEGKFNRFMMDPEEKWRLTMDPEGHRLYAVAQVPWTTLIAWEVNDPSASFSEVISIQKGFPGPVAFPEHGIVAAGDSMDIRLYKEGDPPVEITMTGHDEPVKMIAAGGGLIASLSCCFQNPETDQIFLWTSSGKILGHITLPEFGDDIAFTQDAGSILVLGRSGAIYKITLKTEDWISLARGLAGRDLTAEEQYKYGVDAWRARTGQSGQKA
jgi:WD40 repeat protein